MCKDGSGAEGGGDSPLRNAREASLAGQERLRTYDEETKAAMSLRPGITMRVHHELKQCEAISQRAHALRKLDRLLEKNPEVAQIIDLMRELGMFHG